MSEAATVREIAEQAARRITRKVLATLQQMKNTLSGDDSELKTTWDEICVQIQSVTSTFWNAYDDTVRTIVEAQLAKLSDHEREAIWLQTDAGINWSCEEMDDLNVPPTCDADIVDWVTNEHVYGEAANWSNVRIRTFIERRTIPD
jgi:inorganic triphosphatase YgiF